MRKPSVHHHSLHVVPKLPGPPLVGFGDVRILDAEGNLRRIISVAELVKRARPKRVWKLRAVNRSGRMSADAVLGRLLEQLEVCEKD